MRHTIAGVLFAFALASAVVTPASAANKEHQQLMADIRMLQEQAQILQNMIGSLNEALKAVNTRLDEQTSTMRKAFADEKLLIDNLSSDLRVVREKVDDNNVRIASLTQEVDALRRSMQQGMTRPSSTEPGGGTSGTTTPSATDPTPPVAPGASPKQLYDMAFGEYTSGNWDLAIQGFEAYIRTFPRSEQASDAQVKIGQAYEYWGKKDKALEAFDNAIRNYPNSKAIPDAYYHKGLVLRDLRQPDKAREAFEYVVKNYLGSDAANMAAQALVGLAKRPN